MFVTFFHELKAAKVPVTLKEYLTLMEALQANLAQPFIVRAGAMVRYAARQFDLRRFSVQDRRDDASARRDNIARLKAEFESLREYLPGLDHRAIDWKQSARHLKLLGKEYRTERNNPALDPQWDDANGVAIDAFIFGGRRSTTVPLVTEARDWTEGVYMAATMGSETTAAAFGAQGVVRRDPFAMLPFMGYNMSDYFQHWLDVGAKLQAAGHKVPPVYCVNWFRKGADGKFVWPGYGENMRVLEWMLGRIAGTAKGAENAFGISPNYEDINWSGLNFSQEQFQSVISMDKAAWAQELKLHDELFAQLAYNLPAAMPATKAKLEQRLAA